MSKIKVSVIIPIYNVEHYIESCLCSVLAQQLNNIEIICVNDGSTDHSIDIIKKYALKDSRIVILEKKNGGQSTARNAGIGVAKGEYIYFLDSDDYIINDALQILYNEAKQFNLDNLYFDAESIFESDYLKEKYSSYINYYSRNTDYSEIVNGLELLQRMTQNKDFRVSPCLQFFKTKFLIKNNLKFEEGIIHEDDLFSLKVCLYAKRSKHISKKLYIRRIRNSSTMTNSSFYQHSYGYFRCIIHMIEELSNLKIEPNYYAVILEQLFSLQNRALKKILSVSNMELNAFLSSLPFHEEALYHLLIEKSAINSKEISILKKENMRLQKKIDDLKNSNSFRIGRIITFVPRKIKKILRNFTITKGFL